MALSGRQKLGFNLRRAVRERRECEDRLLAVQVPRGEAFDVPGLEGVADELVNASLHEAACKQEMLESREGRGEAHGSD